MSIEKRTAVTQVEVELSVEIRRHYFQQLFSPAELAEIMVATCERINMGLDHAKECTTENCPHPKNIQVGMSVAAKIFSATPESFKAYLTQLLKECGFEFGLKDLNADFTEQAQEILKKAKNAATSDRTDRH